MNTVSIVCIVIAVVSLLIALKKYVDTLTVIYIMQLKGVNITDDDMRSASTYVMKKLFKI